MIADATFALNGDECKILLNLFINYDNDINNILINDIIILILIKKKLIH